MVELGDRAHQPNVALLDQVQQRHAAALVLLGDRDDQAQVRLGHAPAGRVGAPLDLLGELDLLLLGQEGAPADLAQVRAKGVVGFGLSGFRSLLGLLFDP